MHKVLFFFALSAFLSLNSFAVVVASGGPNNTAPSGQPFFENVGVVNGASGIYLGNGWVMTANHVASSLPANATFGGVPYATVSGSWSRLTNPSPFSALTDIVIFQLSSPPSLSNLSISTGTPTVGTDVMMIGRGRVQNSETFWDRTVGPLDNDDTWTSVPEGSHNISGFTTSTTREIRWGENEVHQNFQVANVGTVMDPVHVLSFTTRFDEGAMADEAQAVAGDSGGAVFIHNGTSWELAGMMFAVDTFENQPPHPTGNRTAVYGNQTLIADLSVYRSQFVHLIPEPSTLVLSLAVVPLLFRRRR